MIDYNTPISLYEITDDFHLRGKIILDIPFIEFLEDSAQLVKVFEENARLPFDSLFCLNGEYYGVEYAILPDLNTRQIQDLIGEFEKEPVFI